MWNIVPQHDTEWLTNLTRRFPSLASLEFPLGRGQARIPAAAARGSAAAKLARACQPQHVAGSLGFATVWVSWQPPAMNGER